MIIWFLLALLPIPTIEDTADVCELNHVFCATTGNHIGSYIVWWSWTDTGYRVRDWRTEAEAGRPIKGVQEWYDKRCKCNRRVISKVFIESETLYDKETFDRQYLPESRRRKLSGSPDPSVR